MKIILTGYMGSGKTGVGSLLAKKLKMPFLDLDNEIARTENKGISEIFKSSGEIYFRKKESQILGELINSEKDLVLALGGGTPCYSNNQELMSQKKDVVVVYLKTSLEELKKRLFSERASRPLISHLDTPEALEDFIGKHLFERTYYYNQNDFMVVTDSKTMEEIVQEIARKLN